MDRRINLQGILEYKPYSKNNPTINDKTYFFIKIKYLNGTEEDLDFLEDKEERNKFLKFLDENLLHSNE